MQRSLLTGIAVAFVLAGITAAIVGCIPYERMQSAGALVRRADDFTPERFARLRHVCWFFALALPAIGVCAWRSRTTSRAASLIQSATSATVDGEDPHPQWILWLILFVGSLLRLQRIADPVAYDEAYTYLNFASRPWYEAIGDYNSTNNHLLNTLLMHVSTRIFGPHEWALRWHVLLAGCLLLWAAYAWARDWFGKPTALVTATAVAISPALITYSTDARGYVLVALAAISFDRSLARITLGPNPRAWWSAWATLVVGLCSMPLMMYPAIASTGWFILLPIVQRAGRVTFLQRLRTAAAMWALAVPAVGAFYSLAYIFRGLMFLNDPIMQSASSDHYWMSLWDAWQGAFGWWTAGMFPPIIWLLLAIIGVWRFSDTAARIRWALPFLTVLALNVVQHVAPPPRVYLHLAPWLFAACAFGLLSLLEKVRRLLRSSHRPEMYDATLAAAVLLIAGGAYAARTPVLLYVSERSNFVSVPEVITAVQQSASEHPDHRSILLAPLPCDLPSIFYLRRSGIELPVNARPEPGDRVYLIARPGESPNQVLATPLLNMSDSADQFHPWRKIADFETLNLYESQFTRADQ